MDRNERERLRELWGMYLASRAEATPHDVSIARLNIKHDWEQACIEHGESLISALDAAEARIADLEGELAEVYEEAFTEIAHYHNGDAKKGWYDTVARSTACYYGDKLVALGKYEKHPDGYGRVQYYRPITKEPTHD